MLSHYQSRGKKGTRTFCTLTLKLRRRKEILPGSVVKYEIDKTEIFFSSVRKLLHYYKNNAVSDEVNGIGERLQKVLDDTSMLVKSTIVSSFDP